MRKNLIELQKEMEHFNEGLIEMDNIIESNLKDIAKIK
jgi:hypothetical protein